MASSIRIRDIPKIDLTENELTWLRAAYSVVKRGGEVTVRTIMAELDSCGLPPDFEPDEIDSRLISYGTQPTLLGAWHAEPTSNILDVADTVITSVRETLLADPTKHAVTADEISKRTPLTTTAVAIVFYLIQPLGAFSAGSSGRRGVPGYTEIKINDDVFKQYRRYDRIENVLHSFVERYEQNVESRDQDSWVDYQPESQPTRVDRAIHALKNHPVVWPVIVVVLGLTALLTLVNSAASLVEHIVSWFQ